MLAIAQPYNEAEDSCSIMDTIPSSKYLAVFVALAILLPSISTLDMIEFLFGNQELCESHSGIYLLLKKI